MRVSCGPVEDDLLSLQSIHVSQHVWNREEDRRLLARRAAPTRNGIDGIPHQIVPLIDQAGFGWIARLSYIKMSPGLLTALVERWRPETHTFHMPFGECTITLQDVGMIVGLPVDGEALLSRGSAHDLLGVVPPESQIKGHRVKLSWLATYFNDIADDLQEVHQLLPYARAWILRFIGGLLFPDRSSSYVSLRWLAFLGDFQTIKTYAWGAAVLGYLYRNLCTSTDYKTPSCGGFTLLLQLWAWERFPTILSSPFLPIPPACPVGLRWSNTATKISMSDDIKFYRKFFDRLTRKSIIWQPYPPLEQMPEDCTGDSYLGFYNPVTFSVYL
ncbi:serine/threonine-protein phosphatase 7 long form homolog [Cajanus cajan]|uniref:serine/threonine-protein phosphatase 7 long form homolog n=1 Tax=Cajanus cajan TaxID=3821 RepID=UPI00098D7977|nr:serine/threonine-protein phosphatase 7 long form homolog [Cajanus cajan]